MICGNPARGRALSGADQMASGPLRLNRCLKRPPRHMQVSIMSQPGPNQTLIQAARDMAEANEVYGSALVTNANLLLEMVIRLEGGEDVIEIVRSTPGAPGRLAARDAEIALDAARFRFRSALALACVERGMARKEIAYSLGCSVQLVSRYLASSHGPC